MRLRKFHLKLRELALRKSVPDVYEYPGDKWGRFPPKRRFNMDGTGFFLSPGGLRTYTFPNERLSGCISARRSKAQRLCTVQCCTAADPDLKVPLSCIFRGSGGISYAAKESLQLLSGTTGVRLTWQKKAWTDHQVMLWWLERVFVPYVREQTDDWVLLLMDACGKTHGHPAVRELAAANRVLLWLGEPSLTCKWQPIDHGFAKTLKDLALGDSLGMGGNRRKWRQNRVSAQLRRRLALKFLGASWDRLHADTCRHLREAIWVQTGCLLTADGSEDDKVSIEGMPDYKPLVAGSEVPEEWL